MKKGPESQAPSLVSPRVGGSTKRFSHESSPAAQETVAVGVGGGSSSKGPVQARGVPSVGSPVPFVFVGRGRVLARV